MFFIALTANICHSFDCKLFAIASTANTICRYYCIKRFANSQSFAVHTVNVSCYHARTLCRNARLSGVFLHYFFKKYEFIHFLQACACGREVEPGFRLDQKICTIPNLAWRKTLLCSMPNIARLGSKVVNNPCRLVVHLVQTMSLRAIGTAADSWTS